MELVRKLWPLSFKVEKKSVSSLVVNLITWVVVAVVAGIVLWLATAITGWIPVLGTLIGWIVGVIGGLIEVYTLIGIVLSILVFLDILKD